MTLKKLSRLLGRIWGRTVVTLGVSWLRRRAGQFDLVVIGEEHLKGLDRLPCVVASNHIWPVDTPLGWLARLRFIQQYQHSADSFLYHRAVRERAGRALQTVGRCDGARWAVRPWKRRIQEFLGQPFARGQMEVLLGYIPVEQCPGIWQRPFLDDVRKAVAQGAALLIFPGGITLDRPDLDPHVYPVAAHIARRCALPILPACILGSDSWQPGQRVTIVFGPPFPVARLTKDEINARITRSVQALHAAHSPAHRQRACAARTADASFQDAQEPQHVASV